jgi:PAS domain S-box-containing protein
VIAIVGACHDVTQRVSIEAERNKAEELQRIVMEAASDIITVHDAQGGNMEFASTALGRLLGRSTDIVGSDIIGLIHPDDLAEVMEQRKKAAPGKITTTTYRMRDVGGHYVWFESALSLVCEETTGELRHIVGVMRDVSERKAAELEMQLAHEAADAANKAKSSFLANMSHELRTPLNAIIGFTDLMCHETFGPIENSRYREYVSLIHNSGQYLLDLINDVLDMAKIESGKFELNIKNVNLAETIGECVQTMAERAASAGVAVNASLPVQGLFCRADGRAMKQILLNLLSNAIKFTPTGGHVDITATIEDNVVRIEIRDDGIGISTADLPRLAKPFVQVCEDPNLAKKGTGLGLALVRALIEQHGGHLTIESPAQEGTIVTIEFPSFNTRCENAA